MVTNPLDLMTYHMQKVTGFPANRAIGQAESWTAQGWRTLLH